MEDDDKNLMVIEEQMIPGALGRILPAVVVIGAMVGFVALAWYAYHAGSQSTKEDDLLVVEADKTPMKEKPADPGGMQFPNQDKTIFETFSNNNQPPKVERVLPTPEEPLPTTPDTTETTTWVNDKLQPKKSEQVIGSAPVEESKIPANADVATAAPVAPVTTEGKTTVDNTQTETYVAPVAVKAAEVVPASVAPPAEKKPTPAKPEPKTGAFKVQLGAYRSEKEATDDWAKIQKKHSQLAGLKPMIIQADLGEKGIYYRLRATGIASAQEAKTLCATLNVGGQACLIPTDK